MTITGSNGVKAATNALPKMDAIPVAHPKRWNVNVPATATTPTTPTAARAGSSSLMSLKAYYRKLRTFKGTVKALINLRRMPMLLGAAAQSLAQQTYGSIIIIIISFFFPTPDVQSP